MEGALSQWERFACFATKEVGAKDAWSKCGVGEAVASLKSWEGSGNPAQWAELSRMRAAAQQAAFLHLTARLSMPAAPNETMRGGGRADQDPQGEVLQEDLLGGHIHVCGGFLAKFRACLVAGWKAFALHVVFW